MDQLVPAAQAAQALVAAADGTPVEGVVEQQKQEEEEASGSESGDHSEYLYEEDAGPVIEYKSDGQDKMRPDFLFSTDNGPRMVEFYAWWYV